LKNCDFVSVNFSGIVKASIIFMVSFSEIVRLDCMLASIAGIFLCCLDSKSEISFCSPGTWIMSASYFDN